MKKVLIWGTGKYCERKYDSISALYEIVAFVDNSHDKTTFHHREVITRAQISEYDWDYIIILATSFFDILQDMKKINIPSEKILLGVNFRPYFGKEKGYMADGRNQIRVNQNYQVVYYGEDGGNIVIENLQDIDLYLQKREAEVVKYIKALPDVPLERAQGSLIGKSVKRFYTDDFMQKNRQFICGIVGEMEDRRYTRLFGDEKLIQESYIVEYHANFSKDEKFGLDMDLSTGEGVTPEKFDCFICTHTLSYILDVENAVKCLIKMIKPGGTLLLTFAGMIHRASAQELDKYKPAYGILPNTICTILASYDHEIKYSMEVYGNIKCAVANLYGIPSDGFTEEELLKRDEDYPLIVGVKIQKNKKENHI